MSDSSSLGIGGRVSPHAWSSTIRQGLVALSSLYKHVMRHSHAGE